MPRAPSTFSVRTLMLASAVVAASIGWSAHWSDCKFQAAVHATLADAERRDHGGRHQVIAWHEEMSRRFERAAWLPWPAFPPQPPRPD